MIVTLGQNFFKRNLKKEIIRPTLIPVYIEQKLFMSVKMLMMQPAKKVKKRILQKMQSKMKYNDYAVYLPRERLRVNRKEQP